MIAYVNGTIDDISEDNVVLDVGGIGYNVRVSASTAGNRKIGKALYINKCTGRRHTIIWISDQKRFGYFQKMHYGKRNRA